jgi:hypothetical protein
MQGLRELVYAGGVGIAFDDKRVWQLAVTCSIPFARGANLKMWRPSVKNFRNIRQWAGGVGGGGGLEFSYTKRQIY